EGRRPMNVKHEHQPSAIRWGEYSLVLPKPSQNFTIFDVRSQSPLSGGRTWYSAEMGGQAERSVRGRREQGAVTVEAKKDDTTFVAFLARKPLEYVESPVPENTTLVFELFLAGSYGLHTQVYPSPAADFDILLTEGNQEANNRTFLLSDVWHPYREYGSQFT